MIQTGKFEKKKNQDSKKKKTLPSGINTFKENNNAHS